MLNVSIVGLGAWGSAIGMTAHRAGSSVTLIGLKAEVEHVKTKGFVPFFPDVPFPPEIRVENSQDSLANADIVIYAVPAQLLRVCLKETKNLPADVPVLIASKGIEESTGCLMSEVVADILPNPVAILSGPNFASEIMRNKPAATTIGCQDLIVGQRIVKALAHQNFRPYLNKDVIGVQIGGAIKNVLAIACGMVRARGLGENALASLITRGLHEIKTFGIAKGAAESTFLGLSGVGDVVLTCMSAQSRNFQFGVEIAQQEHVNIESLSRTTVEGFYTAKALHQVMERLNIQMPVCTMVYEVLYKNIKIDTAMEALLKRPLKEENA